MLGDIKDLKNELQNIIKGKVAAGKDQLIQTVQAHLRTRKGTGKIAEEEQLVRSNEERSLINFAETKNLWIPGVTWGEYITEGAEQKIYFLGNTDYVIKVADAIFYKSWTDYFNNLLVHNHLFPDTAYTLIGFYLKEEKLHAVLTQPYIISTQPTDLLLLKEFMHSNGFRLKKNNDYFHEYLGLIVEDLHDENVLTSNDIHYFVDTVIYLTEEFYR